MYVKCGGGKFKCKAARYQLARALDCNLAINAYFHFIALTVLFAHMDIVLVVQKKTTEVFNLQPVVTFH